MISRLISACVVVMALYFLIPFSYNRIKADPEVQAQITQKERFRQLDCLAENIYYEGTTEPFEGKVAIAQVVIQRTQNTRFPNDICRVIHQPSQFSWTLDKPKALVHINQKAYDEAYAVAKTVLLEGFRLKSVEGATYYHAKYVTPAWAAKFTRTAVIANHIFYKDDRHV